MDSGHIDGTDPIPVVLRSYDMAYKYRLDGSALSGGVSEKCFTLMAFAVRVPRIPNPNLWYPIAHSLVTRRNRKVRSPESHQACNIGAESLVAEKGRVPNAGFWQKIMPLQEGLRILHYDDDTLGRIRRTYSFT
jgi:hypothetical protein